MKLASERGRSDQDLGRRFMRLQEELTLVEAFVSTRVAAVRSELEELRKELGLLADGPEAGGEPLDLPFLKPMALEVPLAVAPYKDFFPGWQLGAGSNDVKCTVQQLPAPDSALTYPSYRLIVSVRREDKKDCSFLSLEFDTNRRYFAEARYVDAAVRVRGEPGLVVNPTFRLFLDTGSWRDLWGTPFTIDTQFRSFATTFEIPRDAEPGRAVGGRLIYYLPADTELRLDLAYTVQGYRIG